MRFSIIGRLASISIVTTIRLTTSAYALRYSGPSCNSWIWPFKKQTKIGIGTLSRLLIKWKKTGYVLYVRLGSHQPRGSKNTNVTRIVTSRHKTSDMI